jgi:hypothetical protein
MPDVLFARFRASILIAFSLGLFGMLSASQSVGREEPAWGDRFRSEAPVQWKKYQGRAKRLQGKWSVTITEIAKQQITTSRTVEWKQRTNCALVLEHDEIEGSQPAGRDWLWCANPNYAFTLNRRSADKPWVVLDTTTNLTGEMRLTNLAMFPTPGEWAEYLANHPVTCGNIDRHLGKLLTKEPGFALTRVSPVVRDGRTLAKVEFDFHPEDQRIPLRGGWFLYDPEHCWVIHAYDVRVEWPRSPEYSSQGSMSATYEYRDASANFPLLKTIVKRVKQFDRPLKDQEYRYEFDVKEADVPEKDFTLSAFGFPEPPGSPKSPSTWYWWTAGAGIVLLVLSVATTWWLRRRQAAA